MAAPSRHAFEAIWGQKCCQGTEGVLWVIACDAVLFKLPVVNVVTVIVLCVPGTLPAAHWRKAAKLLRWLTTTFPPTTSPPAERDFAARLRAWVWLRLLGIPLDVRDVDGASSPLEASAWRPSRPGGIKGHALVTGGAGFIGSHATLRLLEEGYSVTAVDDLSRGSLGAVEVLQRAACSANMGAYAFAKVDLGKRRKVAALVRRSAPDVVLHFAATAYVGESVDNPLLYYRNVTANTVTLLTAMEKAGVKNLVYSSSCATYGTPPSVPVTEETPQKPSSPYGRSKLFAEGAVRDWSERGRGQRQSVLLRYFNVMGSDPEGRLGEVPKIKGDNGDSRLSGALLDAASGRIPAFKAYGVGYPTNDGSPERDYVHVDDLIEAHVLALRGVARRKLPGADAAGATYAGGKSSAVGEGWSAFNLGVGRAFSVLEMVEEARKLPGVINFKYQCDFLRQAHPTGYPAVDEEEFWRAPRQPSPISVRPPRAVPYRPPKAPPPPPTPPPTPRPPAMPPPPPSPPPPPPPEPTIPPRSTATTTTTRGLPPPQPTKPPGTWEPFVKPEVERPLRRLEKRGEQALRIEWSHKAKVFVVPMDTTASMMLGKTTTCGPRMMNHAQRIIHAMEALRKKPTFLKRMGADHFWMIQHWLPLGHFASDPPNAYIYMQNVNGFANFIYGRDFSQVREPNSCSLTVPHPPSPIIRLPKEMMSDSRGHCGYTDKQSRVPDLC